MDQILPNKVYNVRKAADLLGLKPQTVIEYCRIGTIVSQKAGEWKILGSALIDFMNGSGYGETLNSSYPGSQIFSTNERLLLANQYLILEKIDPQNAKSYSRKRQALESGYELEYKNEILQFLSDQDVLTIEECKEVSDILDMFRFLKWSYEKLEDTTGIEEHELEFQGFDGNDRKEVKYLGYARYLWDDGRFEEASKSGDINSHKITLPIYTRMLTEWRKSKDKHNLTKDDIARILDSRKFSES